MHKRPPGGLPIRRRISPDGAAFSEPNQTPVFSATPEVSASAPSLGTFRDRSPGRLAAHRSDSEQRKSLLAALHFGRDSRSLTVQVESATQAGSSTSQAQAVSCAG